MEVKLTVKEVSILKLVADGWSTYGIATCFEQSPKTIEMYSHRLYHKTGAKNKPHLIAIAFREGWVE